MLGYGVVVSVVDDAELAQHIAADGRFDGPVVAVVALAFAVEPFHVENLGTEALEDDANVLNAQVLFLIDAQLVDEQEELL